ncbi:tripartite tricarboxylate transporter substrate binding protein [Variovorax sp. Sphag1AA]|uniref:Bug family tripartite tricarboxylate transporter substrate binding protein n=1 Tax=Variovorax sp. Sphag1AA TaxID=2587027 RepID=UPI00160B7792|nr:tripartite tricarboxylate transporter substrate binding protein [Variovorax sp. Sphag1AA]MBB3181074.1 tripartite-type tricarboxylate transporter receptor subunit TctC [Variovorax sp. Sphag1AA]
MKALVKHSLAIAAMALLGATAPALAADAFPTKPVRLIVSSAAGGFLDVNVRLVARYMSDKLGQQVVVENRPGAGGLLAFRSVKASPADGYTLLAAGNTVAIQQAVNREPGYDLAKDFTGVGPLTRTPFLLLTAPSQPDKDLGAMITRAKANPAKLDYASAGNGSTTHLVAAYFAQKAGLDLTHVPYKGNSAAWPDVISGRVSMIFEPWGTAAPMIREGRMKALGVTSTKRLEVLPALPTIAEQGVPGYSFYFWVGLMAPAGTPKEVVQKLSDALRSAVNMPEVKNRFRDDGAEAMLMSPDEFTHFLKDEATGMSKLVSDLKLPKE